MPQARTGGLRGPAKRLLSSFAQSLPRQQPGRAQISRGPNDTGKSARSRSIALSKRQRRQGASRLSWTLARAAAALMAFGVTLSVLVAYGPWLAVQQDIRPGFNERGALPSTTAVPSTAAIIRPPPHPQSANPQSAAETVPAVASATQSEPRPLLIDPGVLNSPTMRSGSQAVLAPRPAAVLFSNIFAEQHRPRRPTANTAINGDDRRGAEPYKFS